MGKKHLRVVILSKLNLIREGIENILQPIRNVFIIAKIDSIDFMINNLGKVDPEILIMDQCFQESLTRQKLKTITETNQQLKIVALCRTVNDELIYKAYKTGVHSLLSMNVTSGELEYALEIISNSKFYYGEKICLNSLNDMILKHEEQNSESLEYDLFLSDSELKIIKLIASGLTSNEIASILLISKRTVDKHRTNIIKKLKIKSLPEFLTFCIRYTDKAKLKEEIPNEYF